MFKIIKKFLLITSLFLLNNCAPSGVTFLGPIFTGAKTGSIYQASLSYSTGRIMTELTPEIVTTQDLTKTLNQKIDLPDIPYIDKDPIILTAYKVYKIKISDNIDFEPLP